MAAVSLKEFLSRGSDALGGHGWMSRLSRGLGKDYATVKRWANGDSPIPEYAMAAIELIETMRESGIKHLPSRFD